MFLVSGRWSELYLPTYLVIPSSDHDRLSRLAHGRYLGRDDTTAGIFAKIVRYLLL